MAPMTIDTDIIYLWVAMGVSTVLTGLRLWVGRTRGLRRFTWSDYCIVACLVVTIGNSFLSTFALLLPSKRAERLAKEMGFPSSVVSILALSEAELVKYNKAAVASTFLNLITLWLEKASFVFIYLELSRRIEGKMRNWLFALAALVASTFVSAFLGTLFACYPLERSWRSPLAPGFCSLQNERNLITVYVSTMVADLGLIIYPIALLRSFDVRQRTVVASAFVLLTGCLSPIAATVRISNTWDLFTGHLVKDAEEVTATSQIWAITEFLAAFIATCLPSLRLLLRSTQPTRVDVAERRNGPGGGASNVWTVLRAYRDRSTRRKPDPVQMMDSELSDLYTRDNTEGGKDTRDGAMSTAARSEATASVTEQREAREPEAVV